MTEEATPTQEQHVAPEGVPMNPVPCEIHLLNDKTFIVDTINGWGYVEQGIFASGHFKGYSGDKDILIPMDRVDWIDLDYKALAAYIDQRKATDAEAQEVILP